jgi:exodeoxyribonuclease-3
MQIKLLSWNVNGISACHKKGFLESMQTVNPDIIGLQEIKAMPDQVPAEIDSLSGYQKLYHSADRRGYSGTAIFSKPNILEYRYGINNQEHEGEGRVITVKYQHFTLQTPSLA